MRVVKTPYGKMQVVDEFVIESKESLFNYLLEAVTTKYMACCYDPEDYYEETNYIDEDGELKCNSSGAKLFDTEDEAIDYADDNKPYGWVSFAMPYNTSEVFKQFESILKENRTTFFDYLLEAVEDFPKNTRAMYRFAKRRHDDTGAIRKVSKQPYWVHPEGVAKIVMEHGGSDTQIKIAMAHDTMEDAGADYEDLVEKFGKEVADGVKALTNDNFKISKMGKEDYMTDKLLNLPEEFLFVKLADMAYNSSDMPNKAQLDRIIKNLETLYIKRDLGKQCESMLHYALDCAYKQRVSSNNPY